MEKIYMENNKNKKSNTNHFFKGKGVVTASIVIAVVAIFAFVISSFNNPSWAAVPAIDNKLSDEFTLVINNGDDDEGVTIQGNAQSAYVPLFWADKKDGISVFCLENNIDAVEGTYYKKYKDWEKDSPELGGTAKKYSVLYILANGYYNKNSFTSELSDTERAVITQLALWDYLYQTKANNSSNYEINFLAEGMPGKNFSKINIGSLESNAKNCSNNGKACNYYTTYVEPLVEGAKYADESDTEPSVIISGGTDISLTEDKKYYQSSEITVLPGNDSTEKFKVKVNEETSPKGTVIVDSEGSPINEKEYDFNTKLYVRVPVDSVDAAGAKVDLAFSANGYKYVGYEYKAYDKTSGEFLNNKQKIVGVDVVTLSKNIPFEVKIDYTPEVPDTGMNTSQIIYFIGLVVLVCGIGIVYANIKPKENN